MLARDNPFATHRILQVRYRLRGWTWEDLLARLAALHYRAAIVGPKGFGKTTLLEDLEPRLNALGFHTSLLRLSQEQPGFDPGWEREFLASLSLKQVVLLDGAEQMSRLAWWRWRLASRRAGGLILTSHRSGLLPTLTGCHTTPELLEEIVAELLGRQAEAVSSQVRPLFHKHGGNLRDALRDLYDQFASRPG